MGSWISYTFVAGLVLLALYLVYNWLLASDNQPRFNRVVLLASYAMAAVLPLVDFGPVNDIKNATGEVVAEMPVMNVIVDEADAAVALWPYIIICVYVAGVLGVAVMTVRALVVLSRLVGRSDKMACGRYTLAVVDDESIAPFSWRRYIVMNRSDYNENRDMIIAHETAHLDRRHRYDLVLARVFEMAVWYNPAVWLMTQSLRSVHEFEADRAVMAHVGNARDYQMLLIKKAVGRSFPVLANSLNHSKLKKRITMMLKPKSRKSRRVRALALVPAVAVALLSANIPFVASALDTMSATSIGLDSGSKDSKNSENEQPKIYVDGKLNTDGMKSVDLEMIKAISVTKAGEIFIELYKPGEPRPPRDENYPKNLEELKVVSVKSAAEEDKVFDQVEQMPQFPGGDAEMMKFVMENIQYPESEKSRVGKFRVIVKFVVGKDGAVRDAKILRSQGEAFDAEALRVVNSMPKFTPGRLNGEPVSVSYVLPIQFQINDKED